LNITKDTAVTLRYTLTDAKGKPRDSGTIAYLHGGYGSQFPKVEAALEGQGVGFAVTVDLSVDDAFGPRDESLARTIAKSEFPPGVKLGGTLERANDHGEATIFRVTKIKGPVVYLDGNHPLAGEALRFACKVIAVREATAGEIAHRHVHGDHGAHH
jgi:FKBP-type peptidyl-prolyl cis-trans isomerase SlyD